MLLLLSRLFATLLHIALVMALAPLVSGLVAKTRARLAGQNGPALTQPYRDLLRLNRKTTLLPETATDLFPIWPFACFAVLAVTALLTPGFCTGMVTAGMSDFVTIIFLLALARAIPLLAALETGSGPSGAIASREIFSGLMTEAVLLAVLLSLTLLAHSATLDGIATAFRASPPGLSTPLGFCLLAMLAVPLSEETATLTEYSGRYLLLFEAARMLRLMVWLCIIGTVFVPFGMAQAGDLLSWPGGLLFWFAKLGVLACGLALFQATAMKFRPQWLGMAALLGIVSAVLLG